MLGITSDEFERAYLHNASEFQQVLQTHSEAVRNLCA